jgi:hypothetical protein
MLTEAAAPTVAGHAVPPALRDGYEVLQAALRYGFDATLYPRQVLMIRHPDGGPELSFVHGVPQSSTLAAVTYAQDKPMRRELLARAGLPLPEAAAFAIGRDVGRARNFAEDIGYPVAVKPAVGDNMSEVLFAGDEEELTHAIEYLRTPEAERPSFTRTAYGLTLLLEPETKDGVAVAPARYQFFVERWVSGQRLRLLVLDDKVISVVRSEAQTDGASGAAEVLAEVHPDLTTLAVQASRAVPGLIVVALDVVAGDYTRPVDAQETWIVDFSERPCLALQAGISDDLSQQLGAAILTAYATRSTVTLDTARDEVDLAFRAEGTTDPDGVAAAVSAAADSYGLAAHAQVSDRVEGIVDGTVSGRAGDAALVAELLLDGRLDGHRAMLMSLRHAIPDRTAQDGTRLT